MELFVTDRYMLAMSILSLFPIYWTLRIWSRELAEKPRPFRNLVFIIAFVITASPLLMPLFMFLVETKGGE